MQVYMNGREVHVPDHNGEIAADELRELAGVDRQHTLVVQKPDGTNEEINPGEMVRLKPYEHYQQIPRGIRG